MLSRRELCRFLLAAFGLVNTLKRASATLASPLLVDRLVAQSELELPNPVVRTYRADVVVILLGLPVFARKGVGYASAVVREATEGKRGLVALRFAGGANPQRTHGFKYDGSLEEVVLQDGPTVPQAAYFGFVTSSTNESYDQARQRILARRKSRDSFVAAEGLHIAGRARCEKSSVSLPGEAVEDLGELNQRIRACFRDADRAATELPTPGGAAATTFLYSVLTALSSGDTRSQLELCPQRQSVPVGMGASGGSASRRLDAFHRPHPGLATHQASTFRLWLDDRQSHLPVRIEFQPRSYLRISLESEPADATSRLNGGTMRHSKIHWLWRDRSVPDRFRTGCRCTATACIPKRAWLSFRVTPLESPAGWRRDPETGADLSREVRPHARLLARVLAPAARPARGLRP